jgi:hypothetical protein
MKFVPFLSFVWVWLWLSAAAQAQVIISEFMADNKETLLDEDGQSSDWIEIFNSSAGTVDLGGWSLTVDPTHLERWIFPSTNLNTQAFMVVFASGKNRTVPGLPLHTDFGLKASGSYLALLRPDGSTAMEFSPAYPQQYPDIAYGIAQNVTTNVIFAPGNAARVIVPADASLGAAWTQLNFDDSLWLAGKTAVGYETLVPGFAVRNFIANVGVCSLAAAEGVIATPAQQAAVYSENPPVINYLNTGSSANYGNDRTFPGLVIGQDQDNYTIEATATLTIPTAGNWTFGVNSDDGFGLTVGGMSMSYPNPRGPADTLQTFNFPAPGDYPLRLVYYECGGGSEVELYAASGSFTAWDPSHFSLVGDTAVGGLAVRAPLVAGGSGGPTSYRPLIATDVQAQMLNKNATAYIRVPFSVADPSALASLTLRMKYDDGFIAYLNGQEVARRNAPSSAQWNSAATAAHPNAQALVYEDINISDRLAALETGANVLAIQGLNQSAGDSDFLVLPELVEYKIAAATTNYFATPTPGAPNGGGFIAYVPDPIFSVPRGFYTAPFDLVILSSVDGATIRYTTNGSPPSLTNGFTYAGPIHVAGTKVVQAKAYKDGYEPSALNTQTYIFVADVIRQSANGAPQPGWPASWGANVVDYGMDPTVVTNSRYSGTIVNDLQTIPSYSIVTDLPNLFDPVTGIYANAIQDGIEWERPASIETIYPNGSLGFHVNAGLRIRGGYSRSPNNPKHAFRFFFRQEYGAPTLDYPVFASQHGASSFVKFDLRTFQNYSWSFEGDPRGIFMRDQFSRDTQIDMGQAGERGDFYHLYINGTYWGLYNTAERAEANYAASYFGGSANEYDTVKVDPQTGYSVYATDGTIDAWTRFWQMAVDGFSSPAAYQKVLGNNPDGTRNPAYEVQLDADNLIDYMLVIYWGGNLDAPISYFLNNLGPNNWFGFRNTNGLSGWRFCAHDSEHTLLDVTQDRTGPYPAGDPSTGGGLLKSNPQYIFQRLWASPEFKLRVADRVQKHLFNGGALTPAPAMARFLKRKAEIDRAVVGESARWGDSKHIPALTRDIDWVKEIARITNSYIPQRTAIVLNQLKAKGLYPSLPAPVFSQFGGNVAPGYPLAMTQVLGTVYYTTDGSDPRLLGGAISPSAKIYSGPLSMNLSARVKARALSGAVWSAVTEAPFFVTNDLSSLLITEIMYHPPDAGTISGSSFEFIELKNAAATNLDLSGVHFSSGPGYSFPIGTIVGPGQFVVLATDTNAFASKYPGVSLAGVFTNHLSHGGEIISLAQASGAPIISVEYGTKAPWPAAANGSGFSLVPVDPNSNPDPNNATNWRSSTVIGGSPGADDPVPNPQPANITSVDWIGVPAMLRLSFIALPGQDYSVQYRDSLAFGPWLDLTNIVAGATPQSVNATDSTGGAQGTRFYRVLTR